MGISEHRRSPPRHRPRALRACLVLMAVALVAVPAIAATSGRRMFVNPVLGRGQDPSVLTYRGWYYLTQSAPSARFITIRRARSIKTLADAPHVVVWRGGEAGSPCCQWWAPELHRLGGRWFIYAAADHGVNSGHRLQVLESTSPVGPYRYRGVLATPGGYWSIDPSPLQLPNGRLFLLWSGWPGGAGGEQNIYIARMSHPWSISSPRTMLSTPTYSWERHSGRRTNLVNESPEPIVHDSTIAVTYSASGCWTPYYSLGLLSAHLGSDLTSATSWHKSPVPLFQSNTAARIYGPASNGWFTSPNGAQTWTAFGAVRDPRGNCGGERQVYVQPVRWSRDGLPDLGREPLPTGHAFVVPAGDPGAGRPRDKRR